MTNFNFKSDKLEWLSEYIEGKSKMGVFCMIIESHFKDLAFWIIINYLVFITKEVPFKHSTN